MRIFAKPEDEVIEEYVYINDKNNFHHIVNVMRKKEKDKIEIVFKEKNEVYLGEIEQVEPLKLKIIKKYNSKSNFNILNITLYQAIAKKDRLEYLIEKGTEIGIKNFKFVEFERNVVKLKEEKSKTNKIVRWTKIAESAAKQSKQTFIPEISIVSDVFEDIANLPEYEDYKTYTLVLYENETETILKEELSSILKELEDNHTKLNINIVVGPEGGFTTNEIQKFKDQGSKIITLGNNILRTETAGLVLATIIKYECGEFNYAKEEN